MYNEDVITVIEQAIQEKKDSLDLSNRDLSSLPQNIKELKNVTALSLENNLFYTLPPEIGKLTHLQTFNLSYNMASCL